VPQRLARAKRHAPLGGDRRGERLDGHRAVSRGRGSPPYPSRRNSGGRPMRLVRLVGLIAVGWGAALAAPDARADAASDAVDQGAVKEKRGDLDGAIADYTRAIALNPRYSIAYYDRGVVHGKKGELEAALA